MPQNYDTVRATVDKSGNDSRVEVNQRALIDKILARYASAGAVYRELLQNSNDAEATEAEILFTTSEGIVKQVVYRNNGMPFRGQDWSRLKKIAEGNPDVSKVGAFGVGAYTMFSICEEPLVISGKEALAFVWRGDALWTKTAPSNTPPSQWTTFVLPSRDPYPLPDLAEFGEFLCASLTFTKCLMKIRVLVNDKERLVIEKSLFQKPTLVKPPQSSSWWKNDGAVTSSQRGTFYLANPNQSISESVYEVKVKLDGDTASIKARYVSTNAKTRIPPDMARRMQRVTKKRPPSEVSVQIFINAQENSGAPRSKASQITQSFSPQVGSGRIFIGFRTSQTTGLAAHLAAPFVPTVEREAIDLQDPTLKIFNTELLEFSGILMRLTLEHSMTLVDADWQKNTVEREKLEKELELKVSSQPGEQVSSASQSAEKCDDESEEKQDSGLFGFAKFMAKGLTKKIVSVVNNVIDDGSEFLNPKDPRPLSSEERHAVLLMQSFCPRQSTPDTQVGTAVALGFARCMPNMSPPVLTRSGVVRGNEARLPYQGIESFVKANVIRRVVYQNAEEYHTVIARCTNLTLKDLSSALASDILDEDKFVLFLKWWSKYSHLDPYGTRQEGYLLKENIKFYAKSCRTNASDKAQVVFVKNLLFYTESDSILSEKDIPMPESVLPKVLQSQIGIRTITDPSLESWFAALPMEIWVEFISHHRCITAGRPEDENLRQQILLILSKEFSNRALQERAVFGSYCQSMFAEKRCIPFDSSEPTSYSAEIPSNLYLYSAELKAFDGIGSFHKASHSLKSAGVSEEFLLALGVRKSVAIDFLFAHLSTLSWSDDPKPLIEYLRTATLSNKDWEKLRTTRYLPAENDSSKTFAPSELFLPDPELRVFPFIRLLQWPSEEDISERSPNGKFLVKIGVRTVPPLHELLSYISGQVKDDRLRIQCLDYVCKRLGPHGDYQYQYARLRVSQRRNYKILPCIIKSFFNANKSVSELHSPVTCFADKECGIMGFPVIDPKLGEAGKLYGSLFQCQAAPDPGVLIEQLMILVSKSQNASSNADTQAPDAKCILNAFSGAFKYLSSRTSELSSNLKNALKRESFIPCIVDETLHWYRPDQVFFKGENGDRDSLTESLFQALVEFSPFLAAVGVREEATAKDLFQLMINSPEGVLESLGSEAKYRMLLRRIAANPPFARVTQQIQNSPFLLAYTVTHNKNDGADEKSNYKLAKAEEIYIIDNSFFGRMFSVNRAPHESDLEDFYSRLGSPYISKQVHKKFEVAGKANDNTRLTLALRERIDERGPLLVSPSITSRPLVRNAASVLEKGKLLIFEASNLLAVYSLGSVVRRQRVTCCSRPVSGMKKSLYVTKDFDWFDVGYAIGDLILERCQLEDAFFISSLLEAPLEQLRARGFPVDRILKPEPILTPPPKPAPAKPSTDFAPTPTVAQMPPAKAAENGVATKDMKKPPVGSKPPASTASNFNDKKNEGDSKMSSAENDSGPESMDVCSALKQMFPDADTDWIRKKLGPSPSMADIQSLAEQMASGNYQKNKTNEHETNKGKPPAPDGQSLKKGKSGSIRKKLGRAFGFGGGAGSHSAEPTGAPAAQTPSVQTVASAPSSGSSQATNNKNPVPPEQDSQSHSHLENLLRNTVGKSTNVNSRGSHAPDTLLTSIPEGLDRGNTCECVPGHSLKPYNGLRHDGKSHNGIRIFSSREKVESAVFLDNNHAVVESFSVVIARLCGVYNLKHDSVAIYHDPAGGTIAFNANRALHFNIRFFFSLHYLQNKSGSSDCYSYWFVTMAHELAHHLVSGHNKEHGFYTESYVSAYLPKLVTLLSTL